MLFLLKVDMATEQWHFSYHDFGRRPIVRANGASMRFAGLLTQLTACLGKRSNRSDHKCQNISSLLRNIRDSVGCTLEKWCWIYFTWLWLILSNCSCCSDSWLQRCCRSLCVCGREKQCDQFILIEVWILSWNIHWLLIGGIEVLHGICRAGWKRIFLITGG